MYFYVCLYYFAPEKTAGWEMILLLPFGLNGLFSEAKCPVSFREGRFCFFC